MNFGCFPLFASFPARRFFACVAVDLAREAALLKPAFAKAPWYATEKTDGERHWLYHDGAKTLVLLRRDLSIARRLAAVPALENAGGGATILDGEVVVDKTKGGAGAPEPLFVVFDAVRALGDDVGALGAAPARLVAARAALDALEASATNLGLRVLAKTYYGAGDLGPLRAALDGAGNE